MVTYEMRHSTRTLSSMLLLVFYSHLSVGVSFSRELLFHDEHVDDMQCVACNASTFCSGGHAHACPLNSLSDPRATSTTIDDCVCIPGYNRTGDICVLGQTPYYWKEGIAQICPPNMKTVDLGSTTSQDCTCNPGYEPAGYGCQKCAVGSAKHTQGNETCTLCTPDTYADDTGLATCRLCTENSSSTTGATECLCDAGYVTDAPAASDGSTCEACPATFYREYDQIGCQTCGAHMISPLASDSRFNCLCDAGYYFNAYYGQWNSCLACPEDTFKGVSTTADSHLACIHCPANTSSPDASTVITDCECLSGYEATNNGLACTPCFPGTNKSSTGVGACTPCPPNTFSDQLAFSECSACMEFSTAPEGSDSIDDCLCESGRQRIENEDESIATQCSSCPPGQYSGSDEDGFGACFNCTGGTFSDINGATSCKSCPANASSVESPHVECQCKKGYKCPAVPCNDPFSMTFHGTQISNEDKINSFGRLNRDDIQLFYYWDTLLPGYIVPMRQKDPDWKYWEDWPSETPFDTWVSNAYGGYPTEICNNPIDNLPCRITADPVESNGWECHIASYTYIDSNNIEIPYDLSWTQQGCVNAGGVQTEDYFFPVYVKNGCFDEQVIMRALGSGNGFVRLQFVKSDDIHSFLIKDYGLNYLDPNAPATQQNPYWQQTWAQAYEGSVCKWTGVSSYATNVMTISSGPSCDSISIQPCPDGNCEACPVNTYSNVTTSTLQECFACQDNSESHEASESQHECKCVPGYYEKTEHECESCVAGKFSGGYDDSVCLSCSNGLYSNDTASTCSSCPLNSYSHDSPHVSCQCNLGHYCAGESPCPYSGCIPCPVDTFSDVTGDDITCQQCQLHSTSPEGSVNQDACQCNLGHFVLGAADQHECAACPPGTFADSLDATECQVCAGEYVYTPPANLPWDDSSDCVDCELCGTDEYDKNGCSGNVSTSCEVCPVNSGTLHDASKSNPNVGIQSCSCDTDYYGPLGGSCTLCHATQVRPERVDHDTTVADCQCLTGFEPHALGTGELCSVCDIGFYKDTIANVACTACPATFTTQFNQSLNSDACVCQPGYKFVYGLDGTPDTCEICPANTYKEGFNRETTCQICKDFSVSAEGSGSQDNCLCLAGYNGGGGTNECTLCEAGKAKAENSNENCTFCTVNTFSIAGSETCTECPQNTSTNSETGAAYCYCDLGMAPVGTQDVTSRHTCIECEAGKLRNSMQDTECKTCSGCPLENERILQGCSVTVDDVCGACQDNSNLPPGEITSTFCNCNAGYEPDEANDQCVACGVGKFRNTNMNNSITCQTCEAGKFTDVIATHTCVGCKTSCPYGSIVACTIQLGEFSDSGYGQAIDAVTSPLMDLYTQQLCPNITNKCLIMNMPGINCEWPDDPLCASTQTTCTTTCYDKNQQISIDGLVYEHAVCSGGPSGYAAYCGLWSPGSELTISDMNVVHACTGIEPTRVYDFYISEACTPSTDAVCAPCTTCDPGYYSRSADNQTVDTTCTGTSVDTVCVECEANFFCHNAVRYTCGVNAISNPGSTSQTDCRCADGFYDNGGTCEICAYDHYCPNGILVPCPVHSFNNELGAAHVFACTCARSYYQVIQPDNTNFHCEICKPNDFCFNNTAFNCSDDRMLSDAGSFKPSNCTCIDGFFNNEDHTSCIECPKDSYCTNGLSFQCSSERHTLSTRSTDASDCLCRPGSIDVSGTCTQCDINTFCEGDEFVHNCPLNSESPAGSKALTDCLCSRGHEGTGNTTYLSCTECPSTRFKSTVGNTACLECKTCSVQLHEVYTAEVCRATTDAVCLPCSTCAGGYIATECSDFSNAVCDNCTVCDYSTNYQDVPCRTISSTQNTICTPIEFEVDTCSVGQYRGQHTQTSNSFCAPCLYRDTKYLNEYTLHKTTSYGVTYNDQESCNITCVGHSRFVDINDRALGCTTCENGNVLLKIFTNDPSKTTCNFTCVHGYDRVTLSDGTDDCFVGALQASAQNSFTHHVRVTNFDRDADNSVFTVSHTNHSRFIIVVGSSAPTECHKVRGCCYDNQWRVSELFQAGFSSTNISDGCSRSPPLEHTRLHADSLEFKIPDSRLSEVGNCEWTGQHTLCSIVVTIIDTLLWHTSSETIKLTTTRSAHHAVMGQQQYIPFSDFGVNVFFAYTAVNGQHVFLVHTRMQTTLSDMKVHMRVAGMEQLTGEELTEAMVHCERSNTQYDIYTSSHNTTTLTADTEHHTLTYWSGTQKHVRAVYRLEMGTDNDMSVVAIRDLHNFPPLCTPYEQTVTFDVLRVTAVSGLGSARINEMTWLATQAHPIRGELGTLTTFFVQTLSSTPANIALRDMLAVYTRTDATDNVMANNLTQATALTHGHIDFTFPFRELCRSQSPDCVYEYLRTDQPHDSVHAMNDCSDESKQVARAWIKTYFGAHLDGGHVDAICDRAAIHPDRSFAVFFVNTLAFVNRAIWGNWQDYSADMVRAYVWGNFIADTT